MTDQGSFPLTGVSGLPNVTVAFPGEHWSDGKAQEDIVPGEGIFMVGSANRKYWRRATLASADASSIKMAIALRTVQIPDVNTAGSNSMGPSEIMDQTIARHDWVHAYHSGGFQLTLVVPGTYAPGDLLGFDPNGVRPAGMTGTGAWKVVVPENLAFFIVEEVRQVGSANEVILTVRSRRSQF